MTTHLALLRGINVWAQYDKMDALQKMLRIWFTNVTTYIQSGNVLLLVKRKMATIGFKISKKFSKYFIMMYLQL
jgi:uncharacterized protein (DUF1697 family)